MLPLGQNLPLATFVVYQDPSAVIANPACQIFARYRQAK